MPPKLRNNAEFLTIDSIKELWVKEFLPSIQKELRSEIEDLKSKITSQRSVMKLKALKSTYRANMITLNAHCKGRRKKSQI
jgi:hypothetical protein